MKSLFAMPEIVRSLLLAVFCLGALACTTTPSKPIETATFVDIPRFMGDWYVIAHIPLSAEKNAYNAVETYSLADDGRIDTTFRFRKGGFDGKLKTYTPVATVRENTGGAVWGMQFIWPFKAEYRVLSVNEDYTQTVIGRSKRDYVWIMARTPTLDADDYEALVAFVERQGYSLQNLRRVPQRWPEKE